MHSMTPTSINEVFPLFMSLQPTVLCSLPPKLCMMIDMLYARTSSLAGRYCHNSALKAGAWSSKQRSFWKMRLKGRILCDPLDGRHAYSQARRFARSQQSLWSLCLLLKTGSNWSRQEAPTKGGSTDQGKRKAPKYILLFPSAVASCLLHLDVLPIKGKTNKRQK